MATVLSPTNVRRRLARPASAAFTLIEVLVVVAIIALLIAILLPSLAEVRWQAKNAACKAHMHDLGTAFTVYAETYKGGFFPVTPNVSTDTYWSLRAARLLPDLDILICPATKNVIRPETLRNPVRYTEKSSQDGTTVIPIGSSDIDHPAPDGREDDSGGHSYEYNGFYDGGSHALANHHKRKDHFRFALHRMLLVHDSDDNWNGSAGCEGAASGGNNCPQPWDNHGERGMNMMFADGHADWTKKLAGTYIDTDGQTRKSPSASIDRIWVYSQYPWLFTK